MKMIQIAVCALARKLKDMFNLDGNDLKIEQALRTPHKPIGFR